MTHKPSNPPAFPNTGNSTWNQEPEYGMTLRDWFAGKVLAGAAADNEPLYLDGDSHDVALAKHWASVAHAAYVAADAMLAEREKSS